MATQLPSLQLNSDCWSQAFKFTVKVAFVPFETKVFVPNGNTSAAVSALTVGSENNAILHILVSLSTL